MPIEIKLVENIDQMSDLSEFFNNVWANGPDVVSFDLGYALLHIGGYAALAYLNEEIVGASFGARGIYGGKQILHSHVTAATVPGVGYDLKKHQFNWAKTQNVHAITWTFDPLVRRNCVFNLEKLGATCIEFLPNFYGTMVDDINAGDASDRLFTLWQLDQAIGKPAALAIENIALVNHDGHPIVHDYDPTMPFAVYLPEDIENLRKSNLTLVKDWRTAVRNILEKSFNDGCYIDQMVDSRKALLVTPGK